MSKETDSFYKTQAWKTCQAAYMKSVGGLCELCLEDGIYTPADLVHHRRKVTVANMTDPTVTLNWDNLQALCRKHHDQVHHNPMRDHLRYYFDEYGRVITKGD